MKLAAAASVSAAAVLTLLLAAPTGCSSDHALGQCLVDSLHDYCSTKSDCDDYCGKLRAQGTGGDDCSFTEDWPTCAESNIPADTPDMCARKSSTECNDSNQVTTNEDCFDCSAEPKSGYDPELGCDFTYDFTEGRGKTCDEAIADLEAKE